MIYIIDTETNGRDPAEVIELAHGYVHKGTPISQVPVDYKRWCLKQADMDPYVLKALRES